MPSVSVSGTSSTSTGAGVKPLPSVSSASTSFVQSSGVASTARGQRARAVGVVGAARHVDLDADAADARADARERERGGEVARLHDRPRAVVGRAGGGRRGLRLEDRDVDGAVGDDDAEALDADGQAAGLGRLGGRLVERDRDRQQRRVVEVGAGRGVGVGVDEVLAEREAGGAGQQAEDVELAQLAVDREAALLERQRGVEDAHGRGREVAGLVRIDAVDPVDRGRVRAVQGAGRAVDLDADAGDDGGDARERQRGGQAGGLDGDPRAGVGRAGRGGLLRGDRGEPQRPVLERHAEAGRADGHEAGLGVAGVGLVERQPDREHRGVVEVGRVEVAVVGEADVDGVGRELEVDGADEEAEQVDRRAGGGDLEDALGVGDGVSDVGGVDDVHGVLRAVVVRVDVVRPVERGGLRRAGGGVGALVEEDRELLDLEHEAGDALEAGAGERAGDRAPALRRRGARGDDAGEVQRAAVDAEPDAAGADERVGQRDRDLREVGVVQVAGAAEAAAVEVDVGGRGLVCDRAGAADEAEQVELGDGGGDPGDPVVERELVDGVVGPDDVDRGPVHHRRRHGRRSGVGRAVELDLDVPDVQYEAVDAVQGAAGQRGLDGPPALGAGDDARDVELPAGHRDPDPAGADRSGADGDRDLRQRAVVDAQARDIDGRRLVGDRPVGRADEAEEIEVGDGGGDPGDARVERQLVDGVVGLDDVDRGPVHDGRRSRRRSGVGRAVELDLDPGDGERQAVDPVERSGGQRGLDRPPALRPGHDRGDIELTAGHRDPDPAGTDRRRPDGDRDLRQRPIDNAQRRHIDRRRLVGDRPVGRADEVEQVEVRDRRRNPRDPRAQRQLVHAVVRAHDVDRRPVHRLLTDAGRR